jgi:two-component system, OmpR family, response regulator MprA
MTTRVLIVDDDPKITTLLGRGLRYEGYNVATAATGDEALTEARTHRPHLILLDIGIPDPDGIAVCRQLRVEDDAPIIMLTARDDITDKVAALDLGADDYVSKPFSFDELLARMRAVLRRRQNGLQPLMYADLSLDLATRLVHRAGREIELTSLEYDLLALLLTHARQVLTREEILDRVWGYADDPTANALEVHIAHLRQKLEARGEARLIQTVRGIGYVLRLAATQRE